MNWTPPKNPSKFWTFPPKSSMVSTRSLLVFSTSSAWSSKRNNEKNKVNLTVLKPPTKPPTCSVSTLPIWPNTCAPHESRSVPNTFPKVKPQNNVTTPEPLCPKVSSKNCLTSLLNSVTKLWPLNSHEPSSSVVSILPVSKFSVSTPSNNCASTSPTKNSNNSSTTICSFLNRKNTKRKASTGKPSISVWILPLVSNLLKSQWVSCPPSKKSVCSQKPPIRPTKKNSTWLIWAKTRTSVKPLLNLKVSETSTSNFTTTPVASVTTLPTGWKRTRIH